MQETAWVAFARGFGIAGKEGRSHYPTFEFHDTRDGPQGKGLAIDRIVAHKLRRAGLTSVSRNLLHDSWNWGPIHFLHLSMFVGQALERPPAPPLRSPGKSRLFGR